MDGFWIHRVLESEGIESHIVDAASIATSRRRRRAKTDRIDGEALVRALLAYKRGEPRVCAMVRVPTPEEEDRRRVSRERKTLTAERVGHVNRIKGLLFAQGCRVRAAAPQPAGTAGRTPDRDGRPLPDHLKRQISRELDRLELLLEQIKAVEAERDALLAAGERSRGSDTGEDVDGPERYRRRVRDRSLAGRTVPAILTTAGRSPRMPGWHRRHGKVGRSTGNRGLPSLETRGCEQPCCNSPGCGCGTSRIRHSAAGSTSVSSAMAVASARR